MKSPDGHRSNEVISIKKEAKLYGLLSQFKLVNLLYLAMPF
jgi:hypothetical protein